MGIPVKTVIHSKVYYSRKPNAYDHLPIKLNENPVQLCESLKHSGIILDKHLNFHEHILRKNKIRNRYIIIYT